MRHITYFLSRIALIVGLAISFTGAALADNTSTLSFTAACGGSGTSDDGLTWTVSSDGTESNFDNTSGIHYGTNSAQVTYVTLRTNNLYTKLSGKRITKIVVNARDAQSKAVITVSVGSTTFTANSSNPSIANSSNNFRFDGDAVVGSTDDQVTVDVRRPSKQTKAIYVKSITITYENVGGSSAAATITTISTTGITNTDIYYGTSAGSLSASVTSGDSTVEGASVTWSGNNDAVATINSSTGAVTLVSAGSVKFTASYAGQSGFYQASSAEYNMTVTNSTPYYSVTYKANGGTGNDIVDENHQGGSNVTVANNSFKKSGSGFLKWNTQDDGLGTDYLPGATITSISGNINLYAQWEALTYDFGANSAFSSWPNSYAKRTLTFSDASVVFESANKQNSGATIDDQPVTKGGDVELKLTDGSTLSKVTFFCTQWGTNAQTITLLYSTDSGDNYSAFNPDVTSSSFTISKDNLPEGTDAVKITFSNTSKQVGILGASIVKIVNTNPVIVASDPDVLDYDAVEGEFGYSITNPTSATLNATSNSDWITNVVVDETNSKVTFSTAVNPNTTQRTGTITLSFTGATDKIITITQAASPVIYSTIPDLFEAATTTSKSVTVTLGGWVVTGVNGSQVFVSDGTNGLILYQSNHGFVVGNTLSGTVSCNLVLFNKSAELTGLTSSTSGLSVGTGGSVTPVETTIGQLGGVNTGAVVTINGLSYDGSVLSDGTNVISPYNTLYTGTFDSNKTYNVTGVFVLNNTTKRILPRSSSDIEVVVTPSITITATNNLVEVSAASSSGDLALSYENFTADNASDFAVQFYNSNNEEIENPDWITVEVVDATLSGYKVAYEVLENEGSARSAYFMVYAIVANDYVYSNLITINQAAPVVDYATLPFSYVGNESSTPTGLILSGTDVYSSSTPKIKFDTEGDYILLKINEVPGVLTYDIKGNSLNGSYKFSVLQSANGTDYSILKEYTSIDGSKTSETLYPASTTRYIKWVYTTRASGNVALGNIGLTVFNPTAPTISLGAVFSDGHYWTTFFNSEARYTLSAGAKAFTMNGNKQLYLLGDGSVIPAGVAVIVIADSSTITLTKSSDTEPIAVSGTENKLKGSNTAVPANGNQYVLGIANETLGFYLFTGSSIPAMKAYYEVEE